MHDTQRNPTVNNFVQNTGYGQNLHKFAESVMSLANAFQALDHHSKITPRSDTIDMALRQLSSYGVDISNGEATPGGFQLRISKETFNYDSEEALVTAYNEKCAEIHNYLIEGNLQANVSARMGDKDIVFTFDGLKQICEVVEPSAGTIGEVREDCVIIYLPVVKKVDEQVAMYAVSFQNDEFEGFGFNRQVRIGSSTFISLDEFELGRILAYIRIYRKDIAQGLDL